MDIKVVYSVAISLSTALKTKLQSLFHTWISNLLCRIKEIFCFSSLYHDCLLFFWNFHLIISIKSIWGKYQEVLDKISLEYREQSIQNDNTKCSALTFWDFPDEMTRGFLGKLSHAILVLIALGLKLVRLIYWFNSIIFGQ